MNYFSGSFVDRSCEMRNSFLWLVEMAKSSNSEFLIFKNSNPLVKYVASECNLFITNYTSSRNIVQNVINATECGASWPRNLLFLGKANSSLNKFWFAIDVMAMEGEAYSSLLGEDKLFFAEDRISLLSLSNEQASIVCQAKSMFLWLDRYQFCPTCGAKMFVEEGGYKQTCTEKGCRSNKGVHNTCYPRTDPVVIMHIVSFDDQKCLLGRKPNFPSNMYSCLAGFIEPGESVEDAVVRETKEESGIDVKDIKYVSSQPWPFPSSLMIGCSAKAYSEEIVVQKNEMEDVRWFSKEDILDASLSRSSMKLKLPPPQTIAFSLIKKWINDVEQSCKL